MAPLDPCLAALPWLLLSGLADPASGTGPGSPQARSLDVDPAPPERIELDPMEPPPATAHGGWTRLANPRPLDESAVVEDWPSFLGPRRDGASRETSLLETWSEDGPTLLWTQERGEGYASPVVQGERLVFAHRIEDRCVVDCLESHSGRRFWRFAYPTDYVGEYIQNGGPAATPVIEGNRVWVHGIEGMLHCLELDTGRVLWKRDLASEFGLVPQFFGVVSSPLLDGERLVLNLGAPGGPCVVALDKHTGRVIWGSGSKWGASCASPVIAPLEGAQRLLVLAGGKSRPPVGGLMVLDREDGAVLAEHPFRSRTYESVNGTSPLVVGSTVLLTSSYSTGTVGIELVDLDGEGEARQLWRNRRVGIEFSAMHPVNGHVYLVDGIRERGGAVLCLDPSDGRVVSRTDLLWEEDVVLDGEERTLTRGMGEGSLLHLGGERFLGLSDTGTLLDLRCTPEATEVAGRRSLFFASEAWTPLVLSRGLLYVCQNTTDRLDGAPPRLFCLDLRR